MVVSRASPFSCCACSTACLVPPLFHAPKVRGPDGLPLSATALCRPQVYFVPPTAASRSLRHPKKYAVPHCPLLQVRAHACVCARSSDRCGGQAAQLQRLETGALSSTAPSFLSHLISPLLHTRTRTHTHTRTRTRTHTLTSAAPPQMHWWRLVVDEAQMVGPLSTAGTMCERMSAVHRWCVTGGAGDGGWGTGRGTGGRGSGSWQWSQ